MKNVHPCMYRCVQTCVACKDFGELIKGIENQLKVLSSRLETTEKKTEVHLGPSRSPNP